VLQEVLEQEVHKVLQEQQVQQVLLELLAL
jgi:hypothetical protein